MSTTASLTYYPPSTTSSTVTTWLPLTTIYPNHGNCARNFYEFGGSVWAWIPDSEYHSWRMQCLPPVATLTYLKTQADAIVAPYDAYSIGPFLGCPASFLPVSTSVVSESSSATVCCPISYELVLLPKHSTLLCTSAATETVLTVMQGASAEGATTFSDNTATVTATGYSTWIVPTSVSLGQPIHASPITGWNLSPVAPNAASTTSDCRGTETISSGVIAGIAVLAVWAAGGTVAAVVSAVCFRRVRERERRRRRRGAEPVPPGGLENDEATVGSGLTKQQPARTTDSHLGRQEVRDPPIEMTEEPIQMTELPVG